MNASSFPLVTSRTWGYLPDDVDSFISTARKVYDDAFGSLTPGLPPGHAAIKAQDIRQVSFRRARGGYSPQHVDDALDRLEGVFLERERVVFKNQFGEDAWVQHLVDERQTIIEHALRKPRHLFRRVGLFSSAYSVRQVRALVNRVLDFFEGGVPLSADEVRHVQFSSQKRGYNEAQVDAFIDAVINVLSYSDQLPAAVIPVAKTVVIAESVVAETSDGVVEETVVEAFTHPVAEVAPVTETPVTETQATEAPATEAPVTEVAPVEQATPATGSYAPPTASSYVPPSASTYVPPAYPPITPESYQTAATAEPAPVSAATVPVEPVPAAPVSNEPQAEEKPDEDDFFAQFKQ